MYRWHAIGAISVIALQALLIAGLIVQRQRRKVAEADIRAKASALRVSHENISRLNGQLIDAEEAERARIARELHDDVGQRVASLSIGLSSLKRRATGSDGALRSELSDLQQTAVDLAKDLRNLSHELHPRELQQVGLREALRARCEELDVEANVKVELDVGNEWSEPPDPITVCLYRVAQEALHNIAKHANARTGRISLARHGGEVVMRIVDDGRGFESDAPEGQHGIGLQSMRERVRMLGGSFRVQSSKGSGTVATVRIPTEARV
jgi:two-component system sensor histidine kinase UhpB